MGQAPCPLCSPSSGLMFPKSSVRKAKCRIATFTARTLRLELPRWRETPGHCQGGSWARATLRPARPLLGTRSGRRRHRTTDSLRLRTSSSQCAFPLTQPSHGACTSHRAKRNTASPSHPRPWRQVRARRGLGPGVPVEGPGVRRAGSSRVLPTSDDLDAMG